MNGPLPTTPRSVAGSGPAMRGAEAGAAASPASAFDADADAGVDEVPPPAPQADRPATMPHRTDRVTTACRDRCLIACSTSVQKARTATREFHGSAGGSRVWPPVPATVHPPEGGNLPDSAGHMRTPPIPETSLLRHESI